MRPPLRQLVIVQAAVTFVGVALPCLLLPPGLFAVLGLSVGESMAGVVFVRLLGAAFAALSVEYVLYLLRPQAAPSTRLVAIAANGLVAAVLGGMIFRGTLEGLPLRAKVLITVVSALSAVLAFLFLIARSRPPEPPGLADALRAREPGRETLPDTASEQDEDT